MKNIVIYRSQSIIGDSTSFQKEHRLTAPCLVQMTLNSPIVHPNRFNSPTFEKGVADAEVSLLHGSYSRSPQECLTAKSYRRRATIMMSMRSNAKGVMALVQSLNKKCDEANRSPSISEAECPIDECGILAEIAKDAFYRAVIRTANGVAIITKAMTTFSANSDLKEMCCDALGSLSVTKRSNQQEDENVVSILQVQTATKIHVFSMVV